MATSRPSAKRGYAITRGTGRTADDHVQALNLEDTAAAQAGDALPADERNVELPAKRVRKAGLTGADFPAARMTGENVTDDDLAPDTLLRQQQDSSLQANDQILRVTGIKDIGAGFGLDEAELAIAEAENARAKHHIETRGKRRY